MRLFWTEVIRLDTIQVPHRVSHTFSPILQATSSYYPIQVETNMRFLGVTKACSLLFGLHFLVRENIFGDFNLVRILQFGELKKENVVSLFRHFLKRKENE